MCGAVPCLVVTLKVSLMLDGDVHAKNGRRAFQAGSWGELRWRLAVKTEEISVYYPQSPGGASKRVLRLAMMCLLKSPQASNMGSPKGWSGT